MKYNYDFGGATRKQTPLPNVTDNQPGPVEIYNFMGSHGLFKFGDLAVFSLLFSVPVIVLYLFMSRYFSGAFNFGGAVK